MSLLIRSGHRWYLGATHDHGGSAAEAGCGLSGSGLDEAAETSSVSEALAPVGGVIMALCGGGSRVAFYAFEASSMSVYELLGVVVLCWFRGASRRCIGGISHLFRLDS